MGKNRGAIMHCHRPSAPWPGMGVAVPAACQILGHADVASRHRARGELLQNRRSEVAHIKLADLQLTEHDLGTFFAFSLVVGQARVSRSFSQSFLS